MEIHQILNNNVVITIDAEGQEFVAMGKGLAFSKKIGDKIDIRDVEKFFVHKINVAGVGMIGEVIKEQRILNNMTRKTLSEGICSPNEIHLIETNKINPPIHVLNALGDKLAIDLFEYYEFFNYKNREKVLKHRGNFERAIKSNDLEMLLEESRLAAQLEDYQKEPLLYDIKINNHIYKVFVKGETGEVIKELEEMLKIESLNIDPITLLNAYMVLAFAYQIEEQWIEAGKIVEILIQKTKNMMKFRRYNTVIISVFISILSFLSYTEQYEELLKQSRYLREYQEKHSEYNRSYFADYFCSVAAYNLNRMSESKECFIKGLRSALYLENKIDIDHITKSKGFKEIWENLDIDQKLIDELYELLESSEN